MDFPTNDREYPLDDESESSYSERVVKIRDWMVFGVLLCDDCFPDFDKSELFYELQKCSELGYRITDPEAWPAFMALVNRT